MADVELRGITMVIDKQNSIEDVELETYGEMFQEDWEDLRSLLYFQQDSNRASIDQLQIHFTIRMIQAIPKRHNKRCCGITAAMRQNILREAQSERCEFVDQMMAELNKSPRKSPRSPLGNRSKGNNLLYSSGSSQQNGLDGIYKSSNQLPVNGELPQKIKTSNPSLKDVLQAGKMHLRANNSPSKPKKSFDAPSPHPLSKKSTGYSTQSQQEALKEENEKFKEMVALQIERVLKLQRQIENQSKVQLLRKQLYEESIKRLRRVADADVFANDNEDGNHLEDSCETCGFLSIISR